MDAYEIVINALELVQDAIEFFKKHDPEKLVELADDIKGIVSGFKGDNKEEEKKADQSNIDGSQKGD